MPSLPICTRTDVNIFISSTAIFPAGLVSGRSSPAGFISTTLCGSGWPFGRREDSPARDALIVFTTVTFVSLRAPSFMGCLGLPFYFGPVSGGERVPGRLRRHMTIHSRAQEAFRDFANLLVRTDPLMRLTFRQARRVYLTSWDTLALVPQRYRHKCEIHLAIGLTREQLGFTGRKAATPGPTLRCLYAGRFLEWKGLDIAFLAMERLKTQNIPARLMLIGDGPTQAKLQTLARHLGITGHLNWIPWMSHATLQQQFQKHDVLLFPSLRDSGGMAVLEALAHGTPVICTDLGGPATVVNRRCGWVVQTEGRSSAELADTIAGHLRELATNPGLRRSLSLHARRRSWEFEFSRLVEAIHGTKANAESSHPELVQA